MLQKLGKKISTLKMRKLDLCFEDDNGIINLPSHATLNEIMFRIGKKISRIKKTMHVKTDSIPLEVSRYDRYSDYNPHYKCKMD